MFQACFTDWVRETWPERPELVAIDGKTSRRSHDRACGKAALHTASAFATGARLLLGQEAVRHKSNELGAILPLLERLGRDGALEGAVVSIDAIACNAAIAHAIREAGAHYMLAVKANQPTLRAESEDLFEATPADELESFSDVDKGHGRIEQRTTTIAREVDWLYGERRFPGKLRLPDGAAIVRVRSRAELKDRCKDTGASRTSSTGCSMSSSRRIYLMSEKGAVPKTWPSSDTSPSTSSDKPRTRRASSCAENSPDGTPNTSRHSSASKRVNLDSLP